MDGKLIVEMQLKSLYLSVSLSFTHFMCRCIYRKHTLTLGNFKIAYWPQKQNDDESVCVCLWHKLIVWYINEWAVTITNHLDDKLVRNNWISCGV